MEFIVVLLLLLGWGHLAKRFLFLSNFIWKEKKFCANDLRSPKMVKRPMFYGAKNRMANEHTISNHRFVACRKCPCIFLSLWCVFFYCVYTHTLNIYWILIFLMTNINQMSVSACVCVCVCRLTGAWMHLSEQNLVNWNIQQHINNHQPVQFEFILRLLCFIDTQGASMQFFCLCKNMQWIFLLKLFYIHIGRL